MLLCTSIIESGIDIASANTLIVNGADHFGLAALYQLRGRVGRSKRARLCLFVGAQEKSRDGRRRAAPGNPADLHRFLGSGFAIASHDLKIRGAGSLLGAEQSGAIDAIGFELYTQMLQEAVAEMKGEAPQKSVELDVNLRVPAVLLTTMSPMCSSAWSSRAAYPLQCADSGELDDLRADGVIDRYGGDPLWIRWTC